LQRRQLVEWDLEEGKDFIGKDKHVPGGEGMSHRTEVTQDGSILLTGSRKLSCGNLLAFMRTSRTEAV
jgi:hypothetical protein